MSEDSKLAEKLDEKSKAIKFTEEEIKGLEEIQAKYIAIQNDFGSLSINRIRVEKSLNQIDEAEIQLRKSFDENRKKEVEYVESITKKYGDGTLNVEDGVFEPRTKS